MAMLTSAGNLSFGVGPWASGHTSVHRTIPTLSRVAELEMAYLDGLQARRYALAAAMAHALATVFA